MPALLTPAEIDAALATLPGWQVQDAALVRTAELASFPAALDVVARVGAEAEAADHHPDVDIRWRTLTFRCSTHSAGGLTGLDVALAARISELLAAAPAP